MRVLAVHGALVYGALMHRTVFPLAFFSVAGLAACSSAPPVSATPSPAIESSIRSEQASAAPDTAQVGQIFRGVAYKKNELTDWHIELTAGQCYWFIGAGDDGVDRLSVYVWDPSDSRVGSQRSKTNNALVHVCPQVTGTFRMEAKVQAGAGHYALAVFGKAGAPVPVVEKPKPIDLEATITADAASQAPGATQMGPFLAEQNGKMDWYVQLGKSKCYWFIGAGGQGIDDFYIYLWDQTDKRIGQQKSSGKKATYGYCPDRDGMFHVQVKTDSSSEKFKLGVYEKAK